MTFKQFLIWQQCSKKICCIFVHIVTLLFKMLTAFLSIHSWTSTRQPMYGMDTSYVPPGMTGFQAAAHCWCTIHHIYGVRLTSYILLIRMMLMFVVIRQRSVQISHVMKMFTICASRLWPETTWNCQQMVTRPWIYIFMWGVKFPYCYEPTKKANVDK